MMIHQGCFSVEVVEAVSRTTCAENTEPNSGEVFVQVDPKAHYLVQLSVLGEEMMMDPDRVFLAYVNINDEYVGYRQCLSLREGHTHIGLVSTIVGVNKPIRFQEAKLLEDNMGGPSPGSNGNHINNINGNILHMGKVTVKIYEGVLDRRQSAFGNNLCGSEAYQPGQFIDSMTIHCCATPEAGHSFLNPVDAERFKRAFMMKRSSSSMVPTTTTAGSYKRVKTDNGYVSVTPNSSIDGMECDMVPVQQQAYPLA